MAQIILKLNDEEISEMFKMLDKLVITLERVEELLEECNSLEED